MNPLAAMNAGAALKSALAGTLRPAVGGGSPVPRFGPRVAAAATPRAVASPLSLGGSKASPGLTDALSRPKRTRSSGYKKTSPVKGAASLGPAGPASAGPGTGGL